jgi:hypothetical protein
VSSRADQWYVSAGDHDANEAPTGNSLRVHAVVDFML